MWRVVIETDKPYASGGADGSPFRCVANPPPRRRPVRITPAGGGFLHLDEVEVYGEPV